MRELGNVGRAWPWETYTWVVFAVIVCVFCDHLTHASVNIPATHSHRVDTSDQSLSEIDQRRDTRSVETRERDNANHLCYTCNDEEGNDKCNETNHLTVCKQGQDACQMELRYIDFKLSITKRCKESDACKVDTQGNVDNCPGRDLSPVCYYCCKGFGCNKDLPINPLNQDVDPRAVYILTYEVLYNTSQTSHVTSTCGEHYAHSFLKNFVSAEQKLNESCEYLRINVTVDVRARVRIYGNKSLSGYNVCKWIHRFYWLNDNKSPDDTRVWTLCSPKIAQKSVVEVNTYVNLRNDVFTPEDNVLRCAALIRQRLLRFDTFEREVCPNQKPDCFTVIPQDRDLPCIQAKISPRTFKEKSHAWVCPNDLLFDNATKSCSPEMTSPSVTTAVSVPRGTTTDDRLNHRVTSSSSPSDLSGVTSGRANVSGSSSTTAIYVVSVTDSPLATTQYMTTRSWGIEIVNQSSWLQLVEGGDTKDLYFRLWANKTELCNGTEENCSISLRFSVHPALDTPLHTELLPRCRSTDVDIPQVVIGRPSWATSSSHDYCSMSVTEESVERVHTLPLKAMLDWKYDGDQTQRLHVTLNVTQDGDVRVEEEIIGDVPIFVLDKDRKSTCQSINDPHITTFDGLEYNNFYEGEFVLYQHTDLPFSVHAIYQQCVDQPLASCNCAVAVQSGDDVIVIDRCMRKRQPFRHLDGTYDSDPLTVMSVDLYLNGQLTAGTHVYEESDGKKYIVYLPHGAYVKVMVSGSLINVWVVPSPSDIGHTKGLCGTYDWNQTNEFNLRNGSILAQPEERRPQPHEFILDWRVELYGPDSIFGGVSEGEELYPLQRYCTCVGGQAASCGYFHDISTCDIYQGVDVTSRFIHNAINLTSSSSKTRKKRAINENSIIKTDEPILINKGFKPKDAHPWKNGWNKTFAYTFCGDYIRDKYPLGQLCSQIPGVNFNQEITTCVEDIHIIGNDSWADSARDAMKEQCLDEIQKNGNLPRNITEQIVQSMCINDCSKHGQCVNGGCQCSIGYSSADCSVEDNVPPYKVELPRYGLCDRRYMSCDAVIVYGKNFVDSPTLKCHLQKCQVLEKAWNLLPDPAILVTATFINFNAVECPIPSHNQSYIVKVTNDGVELSAGLMFIPFDSRCNDCSTNTTTCEKKRNSCIVDGECYADKDLKDGSNASCELCKPYDNEYSWTTLQVKRCRPPWWQNVPDWVVALVAAVGGSLVGLLVGFLLYKCCCKTRQKPDPAQEVALDNPDIIASTPFEDHMLHRNRGLPTYSGSGDQFADLALRQPDYEETYFYNDGRGVENGIDSNTYFY